GFHYFWPMWPMWAFAGIFALLIVRGPLQQFFVIAVAFNLLWAMTGSHYYWGAWPMLGIGLALGAPRLLAGRREQQLEERVDELSRTRRGALDVQATELRRIERDLHYGAPARL